MYINQVLVKPKTNMKRCTTGIREISHEKKIGFLCKII